MENPQQPRRRHSGFGRLLLLLFFIHLGGVTPAAADLVIVNSYTADVQLRPKILVLKCVEQLRPKDAERVTLELVEVPNIYIGSGDNLTDRMIAVGKVIEFSNLGAMMKSVPAPAKLQMLNNRFSGRMNIRYRLSDNEISNAQMLRDGFKMLSDTRTIQVGGDGSGAIPVVLTLWYRHNSSQIRSYGAVGAKISLRSNPVRVNTDLHRYRTDYQLAGRIEYSAKNRPTGAEDRLLSFKLEREFKERMVDKTKRIIRWLNQPRVLLTKEDQLALSEKKEGDIMSTDVKEIAFRFCGQPRKVNPAATITVGPKYVKEDNTPRNEPFKD
jgi:hypothetical protein